MKAVQLHRVDGGMDQRMHTYSFNICSIYQYGTRRSDLHLKGKARQNSFSFTATQDCIHFIVAQLRDKHGFASYFEVSYCIVREATNIFDTARVASRERRRVGESENLILKSSSGLKFGNPFTTTPAMYSKPNARKEDWRLSRKQR